jgi:hypothetical protein
MEGSGGNIEGFGRIGIEFGSDLDTIRRDVEAHLEGSVDDLEGSGGDIDVFGGSLGVIRRRSGGMWMPSGGLRGRYGSIWW